MAMKELNGIHHISAITADATKNVRFYAGVMGMRLVKKTVNQDNPTVYHLFYADEDGSPGADLTFFEYPGLVRGRAGAGMVHRIGFRVARSTFTMPPPKPGAWVAPAPSTTSPGPRRWRTTSRGATASSKAAATRLQ